MESGPPLSSLSAFSLSLSPVRAFTHYLNAWDRINHCLRLPSSTTRGSATMLYKMVLPSLSVGMAIGMKAIEQYMTLLVLKIDAK